jgi:hypothetical protein
MALQTVAVVQRTDGEGMHTQVAHWRGTELELRLLLAAIDHHCTCDLGEGQQGCPAHEMLRHERVLDHLVYVYRTTEHFERTEWNTGVGASQLSRADSGFASGVTAHCIGEHVVSRGARYFRQRAHAFGQAAGLPNRPDAYRVAGRRNLLRYCRERLQNPDRVMRT